MSEMETDFLICGAGPAGASLACFLSSYGLAGIMIAEAPSTADTPRAHITNMAACEALRDIDLEEECLKVATRTGYMEHTRWCHDMAGEEYFRYYSWGHDPKRKGDYADASPCNHVDMPQTVLEPILVKYAEEKGFQVRFSTTLRSFTQEKQNLIISHVEDVNSGQIYNIRSKYLFGADGARSQVVRQLSFPLMKKPQGRLAVNIFIEADLSHLIQFRIGNLHWCVQPEANCPEYSWVCVFRMVKPWNRWMLGIFPKIPDTDITTVTDEQWLVEAKRFIGDDSINVKLINVSTWRINETVAERYSEGDNMSHCLGDAVHRHPPFNGLGSNTCIQDAFNLAWKVAYVHKGLASPTLLQSYTLERQPVGLDIITRANQSFRDVGHIFQALGLNETTHEAGLAAFKELKADTLTGVERRKALQIAIEGTSKINHALGIEMNQHYESDAIYLKDEPEPLPPFDQDPVLKYHITTYPGSRLPHAWINTRIPGKAFSTIDLAGHGVYCLITGIGGKKWKSAADKVGNELGVKIMAYSIGWYQDYEDVYRDWAIRREVEEAGCVLVRPDRFVSWRSKVMVEDPETKLRAVMRAILGFVSK